MNLTRWKLLAGIFGISVCGLAALAEPACRTVGHSANRFEPAGLPLPKGSTETKPKPVIPPPVEVALPKLVELTLPPVAITPAPATIAPIAEPVPSISFAAPAMQVLPLPLPVPALPSVEVKAPIPEPILLPPTTPNAFIFPAVVEAVATPTPHPQAHILPPQPNFAQARPMLQADVPSAIPTLPLPTSPAQISTVASTVPSDKKLKVTLQMDENNPKFEVRDGEEVVLKVISDKVDVTSPKNKGERWSTLKAMGQVKFMTPGGDGFCDELQVVPGTGEVIAIGHVKFTYNWGKVETSASAEKMNFRLGTQPTPGK
jgi:hypothetical protein